MKEEEQLQEQLEERRKQEEILWKQKSRVQWLKEGEKNTKFFHRAMMHRRHINRITHLEDSQGNTSGNTPKLRRAAQLLPRPSNGTKEDRTEAIKESQTHTFTGNPRAKCSLTQAHHPRGSGPSSKNHAPRKSPRPGWVHHGFLPPLLGPGQKRSMGSSRGIKSFSLVLPALNATFLTLIPKEERVTNPKQFRPIALCNVIYKIITKVIANQTQTHSAFVISKEQAGYVEGRQIMDSVILAHEIIHSLKTSRTPGMLIKLDLSKAFDRASWQYLRAVLDSFGFDQGWVTGS
jgi:hypothetical protein